ncbi:MAG: polysaccharide deacetylase family protein [Candidatus Peregrinibacteria bacterium]
MRTNAKNHWKRTVLILTILFCCIPIRIQSQSVAEQPITNQPILRLRSGQVTKNLQKATQTTLQFFGHPFHLSTAEGPQPIPILTYHYIAPVPAGKSFGLSIPPPIFEKQLKALQSRGYRSFFVRDIPSFLHDPATLPSKAIVLTFDDGFRDFFLYALPLLKKYSVRATLYLVPGFLDTPGYLTTDQVRTILKSRLVEVGAHTMHHTNLTEIPLGEAKREITESKEWLEDTFGITVSTFAYPFGAHSPAIVAVVNKAGFSAAVSTDPGWMQSEHELFSLKRIRAGAFLGSRKWSVIGVK